MNLNDDIRFLKGIGPKKCERLNKMDIYTLKDLLGHYPRRYIDRRKIKKISDLSPGEKALVRTEILDITTKPSFNKGEKQIFKLLVRDDSGVLVITFFNMKYKFTFFNIGDEFLFYGKAEFTRNGLTMLHPEFSKADSENFMGIIPIYSQTQGFTSREMTKFQLQAINSLDHFYDPLPIALRKNLALADMGFAIRNIHFPKTVDALKTAKYRLIFDEFLFMRLAMKYTARTNHEQKGLCFASVDLTEFTNLLPFDLTQGQMKALDEITCDMESNKTMNRLLQGDVGSGKTVVAAIAMYKAVKNGYQAVMMAPTEILANQHYHELRTYFEKLGFSVGYLTGSLGKTKKNELYNVISQGECDIIFGTHALIQDEVQYRNLGLIITDEQHRFGVKQRMKLKYKAKNPDVLIMSATPIPRTLAGILYADLDLSVIDQLPKGRKETITKVRTRKNRRKVYDFLYSQVKSGRQAYVVAPLISENESMDLKSVLEIASGISKMYNDIEVRYIHGEMSSDEKDEIMTDFTIGKIDVLVATVLIEVGINVPNATIMVIENAERFGLAQLHQLRGRVGRGDKQSYCILINNGDSDVAMKRAEIMERSSDGFFIANEDLNLRGPGDIFGVRQHGIPEFKIADIVKHNKILEEAIEAADSVLLNDPDLCAEEHQDLKKKIFEMYDIIL